MIRTVLGEPVAPVREETAQRTAAAKVWLMGEGERDGQPVRHLHLRSSLAPAHYTDGGRLRTRELGIGEERADLWSIRGDAIHLEVVPDVIGCDLVRADGRRAECRLRQLGDTALRDLALTSAPRLLGGGLMEWADVVPDLSIRIYRTPYLLARPAHIVGPRFGSAWITWTVTVDADEDWAFAFDRFGHDNAPGDRFNNLWKPGDPTTSEARAPWDLRRSAEIEKTVQRRTLADGRIEYTIRERLTGRVAVRSAPGQPLRWTADPGELAWPCRMREWDITATIAATADDVNEGATSGLVTTNPRLQLGHGGDLGSPELTHAGLRFAVPTIASGDTIDDSQIAFGVNMVLGTGSFGAFDAAAVDDAAAWGAGNLPSGQTLTGNPGVTITNTTYTVGSDRTYTVTAAVAAVIARAGWAAGNFLGLVFDPATPYYDALYVPELSAGTTYPQTPNPIQLRINFTAAAGGSVGEASGLGAAAGVGASKAFSVAAAAGVGAASGVAASRAASVAAASAEAAAAGVSAAKAHAVGAASGAGTAAGDAASKASSVAAASAEGDAAAVSAARASSVAAASAAGAGAGVAASKASSVAAASADGAGAGVSAARASSVASASALAEGAAVSISRSRSVAAAAGAGTASGVSPGGTTGVGEATGTGTALGISKTKVYAVGTASAAGAATSTSAARARSIGAAAGSGSAAATSTSKAASVGAAVATSSASAASSARARSIALAAAIGEALGVAFVVTDVRVIELAGSANPIISLAGASAPIVSLSGEARVRIELEGD